MPVSDGVDTPGRSYWSESKSGWGSPDEARKVGRWIKDGNLSESYKSYGNAGYDKLIRDSEALERKAKEVREQQSRKRILEIAIAALGPDFKPDHFESAPAYGGYDELVTGHFEYGGDYKALLICPNGSVYSTYSRDVRDISSANSMGNQNI